MIHIYQQAKKDLDTSEQHPVPRTLDEPGNRGRYSWQDDAFTFEVDLSDQPHDCLCLWLDDGVMFYANGYFQWGEQQPLIDWNCSKEVIKDTAAEIYACIRREEYWRLEALSGSFLLLFFDTQTKLTIVTDRLASRQIFHYQDKNVQVFAENIQDILSLSTVNQELDLRSVVEFLRFAMILEHRTLYKEITLIPPACVVTMGFGKAVFRRYWDWEYNESWSHSDEYYVD
ncbi:MAG: hypothetical protein JW934_23675, partial [Anaerolineae bacterium]|nr:hypothetical protein [Anaerolineae bacterium]